jgi:hypothetical protein
MIIKPAEKLSNILKTKVVLERASTTPLKLGTFDNLHQFHLVSNSENKFVVEYGVIHDNFEFTLSEDEAFAKLAGKLGELKKIQFHLLWLPVAMGIDYCSAHIHGNVVMRVVEYYAVQTDEILTRYDVLVQAIV